MFGPIYRWRRRREMAKCRHLRQMAIYGDLINRVGGSRGYCFDCGCFLPDLPPPECDIDKNPILGLVVLSSSKAMWIKESRAYGVLWR